MQRGSHYLIEEREKRAPTCDEPGRIEVGVELGAAGQQHVEMLNSTRLEVPEVLYIVEMLCIVSGR